MFTEFDEYSFHQSVNNALNKVKAILGTTKNPRLAEDDTNINHTYDDKFALVEFVSNTSLAAQLNVLEELALSQDKLKTIVQWVQQEKQTATLAFQAKDGCSLLKEQEVDVVIREGEAETTVQTGGNPSAFGVLGSRKEKSKFKMTQKIKEYHWTVQVSWSLMVYKGNDKATAIQLQSREASTVIVTSGGQATCSVQDQHKPVPPIDETTVHSVVEAPITGILELLDPESLTPQFSIDRRAKNCKTPRRNRPVDKLYDYGRTMLTCLEGMAEFFMQRVEREILKKHRPIKVLDPDNLEAGTRCEIVGLPENRFNHVLVVVREYLVSEDQYRVEPVLAPESNPESLNIKKANLKLHAPVAVPLLSDISSEGDVFVPIFPLLENGCVLNIPDTNALLQAHKQSLAEILGQKIRAVFAPPQGAKLVSQAEGTVLILCSHLAELIWHHQQGVDYVEHMLRNQLVQAIGKEVQSEDFEAFMRFHNQKLFSPEFAPKPFTYAIRRPNHYPDGILAIETAVSSQEQNRSIETMVRHVPGIGNPSIFIPINAATSIEMTGDRYLHGWMQHRFESMIGSAPDFRLVARARQFSSFLLIVGTMAGANKFDPKAAIILQNKDEVVIPLLSNVLPTAQEFKDAIASLSPEQQNFCRAFRAMQLESSVFGLCVIQLKPQLERLLELPEGALTKEIQLTQDLMSLFVEYQIPSDLLSYDGDANATNAAKLDAVKGHVKAVMGVIAAEKEALATAAKDAIAVEKEKQLLEGARKGVMIDRMLKGFSESDEGVPASLMPLSGQASFFQKKSLSSRGRGVTNKMMPMMGSSSRGTQMDGTKNLIAESKEVGISMLEELERQREVIESIDLENMSIRDVERSNNQKDITDKSKDFPSKVQKSSSSAEDFTLVPKLLDAKFAELDTDNALRSTILSTGSTWSRMRQKNLLVTPSSTSLYKDDINREKNSAFDLLDALSRSGTLPIACAELHVVIAVSHCFENDVMGAVIQDNVNPIEKVEKSLLMMGSTIYGQRCGGLLAADSDVGRLTASFPQLFIEN